VKTHPILMLSILIVKYCACLHVVYLLLTTTPCHRMDPPAPQHLGGQSRCCHISEWPVAVMELTDGCKSTNLLGSHEAQHPDVLWDVIYCILPITVAQLVLESTHLVQSGYKDIMRDHAETLLKRR